MLLKGTLEKFALVIFRDSSATKRREI